MANNSVDKLNIEITADASKAQKAISDLAKGMQALRTEARTAGQGANGIKEIAKEATKTSKGLEQVAKSSEKVADTVKVIGSASKSKIDTSNIKAAQTEWDRLGELAERAIRRAEAAKRGSANIKVDTPPNPVFAEGGKVSVPYEEFERAKAAGIFPDIIHTSISKAAEAMRNWRQSQEEAAASTSRGNQALNVAKAVFEGAGKAISVLRSGLHTAATAFSKFASVAGKAWRNVSSAFRNIANAAKSALQGIANFGSKIGSTVGKLASLGKGMHGVSGSVKGASASFKDGLKFVMRYVLGFRSLFYMARRLRRAVAEAFTNLSQYSSETNANLSLLSSRLTQAKNSLATAFDPILTIITPILDHFIQLLIGAMNVVGQFFATLSGASTFKKATFNMQDFAASADNSAASSGRAADAAEKLKKSLMGFDKINKLDEPNESSSGSGGGGGSGGSGLSGADMFTTETVNTGISNFAEMVKSAWKESDFTDVGNLIGEKIASALTSIPWDTVKKKAAQFGKSFATFFNGLLESEIKDDKGKKITLGNAIGTAIGETINSGITFLNTLTDKIHFDSIGKFIADGMNAMTITVNWDGIAETLANAANGVFDAAATWSGEFEFDALATAIKNTVKNTLDNIEWDKAEEAATNIGAGLADALNIFFTEDMFDSISTALASAVNTAITGGYTFIGRIEWEQWGTTIKNGIVNFFDRIKWKEIGVTAANLATGLGTVVNTLFETGNTLIGRIEWKEWGETIKNGINNFFDTVNWKNIGVTASTVATGLANALNTIFMGAYTLLGRIEWSEWGKTVGIAITNFFKTVDWKQVGVTFSDAATGFAKFIREAIETIDFKDVGNDVATALANIDWVTLFNEAGKLIKIAAESLVDFVAGLLTGLQEALENWVREHFPKVIADIILEEDTGVVDGNDRVNGRDNSLGWKPESGTDTGDTVGGSSGRGMNGTSFDTAFNWDEEPTMTVHLAAQKEQSYVDNVDNDFDKTEDKGATVSTFGKMMSSFTDAKTQFASLVNNDVLKTVKGEVKRSFDDTKTRFDSVFDDWVTKYAQGEKKPSFTEAMDSFRNWTNDEVKKTMTAEELKEYTEAEDAFYDWADQEVLKRLGAQVDSAGSYTRLHDAWVNWRDEDAKKKLLAAWDDKKDWESKKKEYNGVTNTDAIKTMMAEFGTSSTTTGKGKKKKTTKLKWADAVKQWTNDIKSGDATKTLKGKETDSFENASKAYNKLDSDTATITFDGRKTSSLANAISAFADTLNNKISSAKELWSKVYYKAKGGSFYGGFWHDIPQYAAGAVPTHGTVFVAGERGAEAVANIGGRTEVLNQSQMASVMYDAVLRGMVQAMSVAGNGTVVEVHLDSDARKMFRVIQTEANNYTNATGRPAFNM